MTKLKKGGETKQTLQHNNENICMQAAVILHSFFCQTLHKGTLQSWNFFLTLLDFPIIIWQSILIRICRKRLTVLIGVLERSGCERLKSCTCTLIHPRNPIDGTGTGKIVNLGRGGRYWSDNGQKIYLTGNNRISFYQGLQDQQKR